MKPIDSAKLDAIVAAAHRIAARASATSVIASRR
jgi:hypothetical protein